jgi:hypothetical protein
MSLCFCSVPLCMYVGMYVGMYIYTWNVLTERLSSQRKCVLRVCVCMCIQNIKSTPLKPASGLLSTLVYVCMYVCMYVCTSNTKNMYILFVLLMLLHKLHVYVYMYVCMYVCMYVYTIHQKHTCQISRVCSVNAST